MQEEGKVKIKEIKIEDLYPEEFIKQKVKEISSVVGTGIAINALSGGVDSSVVTMLGYKSLGGRLKTYFIDNGLMREGEPKRIALLFEKLAQRIAIEVPDVVSVTYNITKKPPSTIEAI